MKRIPKKSSQSFKISPINLYLEDLEHLTEKALSNNFKISYSDDEFEFESIDEIKKYRGSKVRLLKILIGNEKYNKSIQIVYKKGVFDISSWMPTDELKLLFIEIVDYIKSKHSVYINIMNPSYTFFPWWFVLCSTPILLLFKQNILNVIYLSFLSILTIIILISISKKYCFSHVYFERRHSIENFWSRNIDKIILLIIGAFFGALAKWLLDKLFN